MKKRISLPLISGAALIFVSFIIFFILNMPTMRETVFRFDSVYQEKSVELEASLYEAEDADYAVLICPGYSCDRQKWRPMANLFRSGGMTVMTFDYSGQGASYGTIGFDNAKTDAIPEEIDDALQVLHEKTGIPYDHIILVGHSMGGRAILRLLYDYNHPGAETNVQKKDIRNVILFSPEVNYEYNAQASLFAGTSDAEEEPWKSYSASDVGDTHVYLYGSYADDIVKASDIFAIAGRIGAAGTTVQAVNGVLHSYQMYSPQFASLANSALQSIDPANKDRYTYSPAHFVFIYIGWFLGLAGVFLFLFGMNRRKTLRRNDCGIRLVSAKKFLLWKLFLWLPGTFAAGIICTLLVLLPFGSPVMNLPYMCFIAGYGLVMLLAYRKGKFRGTEGKLAGLSFKVRTGKTELISCIGVSVVVSAFVWYVLHATMYRLIPLNFRLVYVVIAAVLMGIGYYISGAEQDMLEEADASRGVRLLYNLIQYVPLFLLVLFYLVIGSYSGMIGQIQNMVLMYIFCVPLGTLVRKKTGNRLLGAAAAAFLFQTLMITSAAMIAIF